MSSNHLDMAIAKSHEALQLIINGDASGYKALYSSSDDITLGNPFGPFAKGRDQVETTLEGASQNYREGQVAGVDLLSLHKTETLAVVVENERGQAKIGGGDEYSMFSLRVTSVYRSENNAWKLVHRHADPITSSRSAETVISG